MSTDRRRIYDLEQAVASLEAATTDVVTESSPPQVQLVEDVTILKGAPINVLTYADEVVDGDWYPAVLAAAEAANALGESTNNDILPGGGVVYLPPGDYTMSTGIDVSNYDKLMFCGAGMEETYLRLASGATGSMFYGTRTLDSAGAYIMFRDMTVYGNSTTTGHGFDLTYMTPFLRFENVEVANFTDGFRLSNCFTMGMWRCYARVNRGWGFNFNRQIDNSPIIGCYAVGNGTGGFRCADGFQGPLADGSAVANPIGILVEHTANQGSGSYGTNYAPVIANMVVEGDATQTVGIKAVSATATKQRLCLLGCLVVNGEGDLVNLAGVQYGYIAGLDTQGDGTTNNQVVLGATCADTMIVGHKNGSSGTVFTDNGSNNVRLNYQGWSKLSSYGNVSVYLAAGDANPQLALARDGGGNPEVAFGAGGGSAVSTSIARNGATGLKVTAGRFDCPGGVISAGATAVYLNYGDTHPQISLARDGGGNPQIDFGAGGSTAVAFSLAKNGTTGLKVNGGDLDASGGLTIQSNARILSGTGVPGISAPNGSIFLRTDGAAGTTIYMRVSGAWVANA